jgi:hypothetical protein
VNANSAAGRPPPFPAGEHAAEVGGGDGVAEHRLVEGGELAQREALGREGEGDVRVGQLAAQALVRAMDRARVAEGDRRQVGHRMPRGVGRQLALRPGRDERDVRRVEQPELRVRVRARAGVELLEVADDRHTDLRRQVPARRAVERLALAHEASGQ